METETMNKKFAIAWLVLFVAWFLGRGEVVIKQIVCDGVLLVILGTIVAWLYRDTPIPLRAR
jgi:urea transporter